MIGTIRLDSRDNVVVVKADGIYENIPIGHKLATRKIKKGQAIIKYGEIIGFASKEIDIGDHVHIHNLSYDVVKRDYAFCSDYELTQYLPEDKRENFEGIVRANGKVGSRNYVGVLATSNCSSSVVRMIADHFTKACLQKFPEIDGVVPFVHGLGCGMEEIGEPMDLLRRTLAGYIRNPNMAGALVVALGCERNNIDKLFEAENLSEGKMLKKLVIQDEGGTRKTIEKGIEIVEDMLVEANDVKREAVSAEYIVLALQCGGSDSFSGLTANPALGYAADRIVKNGGTVILSETTEIYGAEHILTRRAQSPMVAQSLVDTMDWWKGFTEGKDCQMSGVLPPGNLNGGLTNTVEKSLGGIKKAGKTALMGVYKYGQIIDTKGFVFMDTAAHDPVSVTGQIAGGANVIAFTTGRGSCFGAVPVPSIKLASNTSMFNKMEEDMDVNCGIIVDRDVSVDEMGDIIFKKILAVASGEKVKSEELGLGLCEFVPWDIGIQG